ncbi:MAG: hypothetical protein A2W47_02515 [Gammaproteobacteria bacterium RIFCSPHIGHO2_12_38_15]|nr:MAG: hypothetical protein A2W47_02515 [Gammaproteobacteria bacterium RIFCSPHIGHO2_12_38_15]
MNPFIRKYFQHRNPAFNWLTNFTFINVLLFWILGLPFLTYFYIPPAFGLTKLGIFFAGLFFLCAYLGQLALLSALPLLILLGFFILFLPQKKMLLLLGTLLGASLLSALLLDIFLYKLYRFHFNGVLLQFFLHGGTQEIMGLSPREYTLIFVILFLFLLIEYGIGLLCWDKIKLQKWRFFHIFVLLPPAALLTSYTLFFSAGCTSTSDNLATINNTHGLTIQAPIIPLYHNTLTTLFSTLSLEELFSLGQTFFMQQKQITKNLNYPQHPLAFKPIKSPPNIVIIGLDAWRFDMLTHEITPNIYAFSKKCFQFKNHFSGGNGTESGLFSLFYSIPSTYWSAALEKEQGPLLFHELIKKHYQLGMFVSAETYNPPYNKTLFSEIPSMPTSTPGDEPYQRDAYITDSFKTFIKKRDAYTPFFSFIFYNTSHSYCSPNNYPKTFLPSLETCDRFQLENKPVPLPFFNRYRNALHYVDSLVGKILLTLEEEKLLDNTIVFIISDHGEEFNENELNYWGHASNFTPYQIHVPLLVYWPKQSPRAISYQTSHFDIIPTLFKTIFKCQNPTDDYSVGKDLFDSSPRLYLVVGSYIDFGIVEKDQITRILPGGAFEIRDTRNHLLNSTPSNTILRQALTDTRRFYKSS